MSATNSNVYAKLNRLKKAAEAALEELNATLSYVTTQQVLLDHRKAVIEKMTADMSNLQKVLEIMAVDNPALYQKAAKEHNLT